MLRLASAYPSRFFILRLLYSTFSRDILHSPHALPMAVQFPHQIR